MLNDGGMDTGIEYRTVELNVTINHRRTGEGMINIINWMMQGVNNIMWMVE